MAKMIRGERVEERVHCRYVIPFMLLFAWSMVNHHAAFGLVRIFGTICAGCARVPHIALRTSKRLMYVKPVIRIQRVKIIIEQWHISGVALLQ